MTFPINVAVKSVEATHASIASLQFLTLLHPTPTLEQVLGILALISFLHFAMEFLTWAKSRINMSRERNRSK